MPFVITLAKNKPILSYKNISRSSSEETTAALLFSLSLSFTLGCILFLAAAAGDTVPDTGA
jgi:hypothetical protein